MIHLLFLLVHNGTIQGIDYELNDTLELFNFIKNELNSKKDMKSILINIYKQKEDI